MYKEARLLVHWFVSFNSSFDFQIWSTIQEPVYPTDIQSIDELKQWLTWVWCSVDQEIIDMAVD